MSAGGCGKESSNSPKVNQLLSGGKASDYGSRTLEAQSTLFVTFVEVRDTARNHGHQAFVLLHTLMMLGVSFIALLVGYSTLHYVDSHWRSILALTLYCEQALVFTYWFLAVEVNSKRITIMCVRLRAYVCVCGCLYGWVFVYVCERAEEKETVGGSVYVASKLSGGISRRSLSTADVPAKSTHHFVPALFAAR